MATAATEETAAAAATVEARTVEEDEDGGGKGGGCGRWRRWWRWRRADGTAARRMEAVLPARRHATPVAAGPVCRRCKSAVDAQVIGTVRQLVFGLAKAGARAGRRWWRAGGETCAIKARRTTIHASCCSLCEEARLGGGGRRRATSGQPTIDEVAV